MINPTRIPPLTISVLAAAVVVLLGAGAARISAPGPPAALGDGGPPPAEHQALVDFAHERFAMAGIDLPTVQIDFPDDEAKCHGYGGVYVPASRTVRICRPSKATMVHELAHSWVETVLDDDDRRAFLELRGLDHWAGGEHWDGRGAEHAAEIITWGVLDEDISVPWRETAADGSIEYSWRLFKIPDSSPAQLIEAYEQLTGSLPALRVLDEPCDATPAEVTSPEAVR